MRSPGGSQELGHNGGPLSPFHSSRIGDEMQTVMLLPGESSGWGAHNAIYGVSQSSMTDATLAAAVQQHTKKGQEKASDALS